MGVLHGLPKTTYCVGVPSSLCGRALILNYGMVMYVSVAINNRNQIELYLTFQTRFGVLVKKLRPFFLMFLYSFIKFGILSRSIGNNKQLRRIQKVVKLSVSDMEWFDHGTVAQSGVYSIV